MLSFWGLCSEARTFDWSSERDPSKRHTSVALDSQHHSNFSETILQQIIRSLKDLAGSSEETVSVTCYHHFGYFAGKRPHSFGYLGRGLESSLKAMDLLIVSLSEPLDMFLVQKPVWCSGVCKMGSLQLHCFPDIQPRLFVGLASYFLKTIVMLVWAVPLALLLIFAPAAAHLWMWAASCCCPLCLRSSILLETGPCYLSISLHFLWDLWFGPTSAWPHHREIPVLYVK